MRNTRVNVGQFGDVRFFKKVCAMSVSLQYSMFTLQFFWENWAEHSVCCKNDSTQSGEMI